MDTTALSDAQKLADAKALARSFKTWVNGDLAKKKSEPSRQARKTDAKRSVESKEQVLTPKSRYNGKALHKGQSSCSGSPKISVMSSALDFLRRVDQVPTTSAAMDSRTTTQATGTSFDSPGAPPPDRKQEPKTDESLVAVHDQKSDDETNADQVAGLLDSCSLKETTHVTEDTSGPLLQIFLVLLAEQIDLPPYLQELRKCAKKGKAIDGAPPDGELEPHHQGSESRGSIPSSPDKKSQLRFNAPAFVPTGSQDWNVAHDGENKLFASQ
ncbi:hypothetical protein E4U19_002665 [Claviceps sp. Clav32 group G5]|nr:hypothetical protein E4U19_002665 [Claviceps sp. Clav32 group G5]KAG6046169.1 hypothetical protein E4U39_001613 [Claviceps sp. Clav50 group G5]